MNERAHGLNYFFTKCAKKYQNDDILKIKYNCADRGNENDTVKEYSMCYNKNNKNLKKYCGPD
jgi:hypothetical protein